MKIDSKDYSLQSVEDRQKRLLVSQSVNQSVKRGSIGQTERQIFIVIRINLLSVHLKKCKYNGLGWKKFM